MYQNYWMQTSQTGDKLYSDTCHYCVCSLIPLSNPLTNITREYFKQEIRVTKYVDGILQLACEK